MNVKHSINLKHQIALNKFTHYTYTRSIWFLLEKIIWFSNLKE